jgi:hypothetical protein
MSNITYRAGDQAPFHPNSTAEVTDHCIVCGNPTPAARFWVEVVNGGDLREQDGLRADNRDAGYMGWWPVGSECRRKFAPRIAVSLLDHI